MYVVKRMHDHLQLLFDEDWIDLLESHLLRHHQMQAESMRRSQDFSNNFLEIICSTDV